MHCYRKRSTNTKQLYKKWMPYSEAMNEMVKEIPSGRIADSSEVAAAVAFLATPAAGYINGINLPVDGGRTGSL